MFTHKRGKEMITIEDIREIKEDEMIEKFEEYLKTPEGQFYNQPWFRQYQITDGGFIFEETKVEFIPFEKFQKSRLSSDASSHIDRYTIHINFIISLKEIKIRKG